MVVRRPVAGYRPPSERITELRAEVSDGQDLARRLRVTLAVAQYAHPNPPLPGGPIASGRPTRVRRGPRLPHGRLVQIPAQRAPESVEMWPQRKGVRILPRHPEGGRS